MTARRLLTLLPWLLIIAIGLLSAWLRYGFIELAPLAHRCDDANAPMWCGARQFIVIGFNSYGFGIAALLVTVPALILEKPWLACLAAALGVFALTLYCYYAGAVALLVGCLRLVRLQANAAMATPRHPHRQGDGKVQSQP